MHGAGFGVVLKHPRIRFFFSSGNVMAKKTADEPVRGPGFRKVT
jgi:hypothetical protein